MESLHIIALNDYKIIQARYLKLLALRHSPCTLANQFKQSGNYFFFANQVPVSLEGELYTDLVDRVRLVTHIFLVTN